MHKNKTLGHRAVSGRMNDRQKRLIIELWRDESISVLEIASRANMSVSGVSTWASRHREACPKRKQGNKGIDGATARRVAQLKEFGISCRDIAQMYGVSESTIYRCMKRKTEPEGKLAEASIEELLYSFAEDVTRTESVSGLVQSYSEAIREKMRATETDAP